MTYVIRNMSKTDSSGLRYMTPLSSRNGSTIAVWSTGAGTAAGFSVGNSYEVRTVQSALDEVGRGKGTFLSGNIKYGPVTIKGTSTLASYPDNILEPCYAWDNINTAGGVGINQAITLRNGGY